LTENIRALVVDDSAFMRVLISDLLKSDPGIDVIATARDGKDALEKVRKLRPDVVTLDIKMPKMDGLTALCHIMDRYPTPTIMVSGMDKEDKDVVFRTLEYGAIDFVSKPSNKLHKKSVDAGAEADMTEMADMKRVLIEKVKMASKVNVKRPGSRSHEKARPTNRAVARYDRPIEIIAIGASTGGPRALTEIFKKFPKNLPAAIIVVQHMPPGFTRSFARRLHLLCQLNVKEAEDGDVIEPGNVYIAPGGFHLRVKKSISKKNVIRLSDGAPVNNVKPSIDVMMESIAKTYQGNTLGVILTGMGADGARGMVAIKENDGMTIAEDETSCVIYGMPKSTIDKGVVDDVFPISKIPGEIMDMLF